MFLVERRILVDVEFVSGSDAGLIGILAYLCDSLDHLVEKDVIVEYDVGVEMSMSMIKDLPTHVADTDEEPKVIRDLRDKVLEPVDRR